MQTTLIFGGLIASVIVWFFYKLEKTKSELRKAKHELKSREQDQFINKIQGEINAKKKALEKFKLDADNALSEYERARKKLKQ